VVVGSDRKVPLRCVVRFVKATAEWRCVARFVRLNEPSHAGPPGTRREALSLPAWNRRGPRVKSAGYIR
jgi:hypothetical protein